MNLRTTAAAGIGAGLLALGAVAPAQASVAPARPIVGGTTATGSTPWAAVLLDSDGGQWCSGTLVAAQWVVTAKHCLSGAAQVRVGSKDWTSGGTLTTITKKLTNKGDLALVKLSKAVDYEPLGIAQSSPAPGDAVSLYGWGVTCDSGCDSPRELKQLDTEVTADDDCASDHIRGKLELCVTVTTEDTACYGDSGGPAVVDGLLVGADFKGGNVCGDAGGEVYTDVTAQRSWVLDTIG